MFTSLDVTVSNSAEIFPVYSSINYGEIKENEM